MKKFFMIFGAAALSAAAGSEAVKENWNDRFYQYRIPVVVDVPSGGLVRLPIDEAMITGAVNQLEEMKYDPLYFSYNYVKIVETDAAGRELRTLDNSGFHLNFEPSNLAAGYIAPTQAGGSGSAMFEDKSGQAATDAKDDVDIPVLPGQYYFLSYAASGGGSSPLYKYEPIHPVGTVLRKHRYRITYQPRLLKQDASRYEELFVPDNNRVSLTIKGRFVGKLSDITLRKAQIGLLAEMETPGRKYLNIYYQPMCGYYLMLPRLQREDRAVPSAALVSFGAARKELGATRYGLKSDPYMDIWFAETTVKLTPSTAGPGGSVPIRIAAAKNERKSFQLVLSPRQAFNFKDIRISELTGDRDRIGPENLSIKAVDFVPVRQSSQVTPARYLGWLGDPLVAVKPQLASPEKGNLPFWITVGVPDRIAPGLYRGTIDITGTETGKYSLPVELTVHDFALPEFSPLQVNMGGQFFVKKYRLPQDDRAKTSVMEYHGLKTRDELLKLSRTYYEEMARNKFYPKNAALFSEISMKWDAPPRGCNVDLPDNFFKLYDWDFTEFNRQLDYYINKLKINQVTIYHTNPRTCKIFMHLPGGKRETFVENPPMFTMGWQSFRDSTYVTYDKKKDDPYQQQTIEISRTQYDRLLLDYFRAVAGNLEANGWLQYAVILADESHADEPFLHFLRLLKSDPLTARLRVGVCIQGLSYFYFREKNSPDYAYKGLLDFYIPQMDEVYNRWEKNYFSDYGITPDRRKLWNYIVNSARWTIDVPGVNNRIIGLDLFNRGCGGILCWDTYLYDNPYSVRSRNPWVEPFSIGNGACSFFYPPDRYGVAEKPDFTVTPSLRMEVFREAVNDYEYAWLLENLISAAEKKGIGMDAAKRLLQDIDKSFFNSVFWTQNDSWILDLRERLAAEITALQQRINGKDNPEEKAQ